MSEVSLEAESETITKDPQMDYKEDHKTEDSLRSDLDDENEGSYESVDLDKDHYHTDAHRLEGGFEEMDQQLDADVQGVGTGVHSDTDDHSSGDDVIMKGSADEGELHGTHHHTNTSETPEANGESCSSQTQVIFCLRLSACDRPPLSVASFSVVNSFLGLLSLPLHVLHTCCCCGIWLTCQLLLWFMRFW